MIFRKKKSRSHNNYSNTFLVVAPPLFFQTAIAAPNGPKSLATTPQKKFG